MSDTKFWWTVLAVLIGITIDNFVNKILFPILSVIVIGLYKWIIT